MLLALPAGKSAVLIPQLLDAGMKVVDGGPDFRLHEASAYPRWYKFEHPAPALLKEAAFGIPELHRDEISKARLVAQPGCYATAAILALAPLAKAGLIEPEIIIDAKSGLSGAGRTALSLPYLFSEAAEDVSAYGFPAHRHLPEIEQELGLLGAAPEITFVPHLVPTIRGIFATAYAKPRVPSSQFSVPSQTEEAILQCMRDFYADSPFVHVSENLPHTKWTSGTNHAFLSARVTPDGKRAVLLSVIDNLGKGLSGQMVQCMNLMFGVEESGGLEARAVYP
jgi:N-acetyl-gamma-glutamyl-phosphate reductase